VHHLIIKAEQRIKTGHSTLFSVKNIISIAVSISCSCIMPEGWAAMASKPESIMQSEPVEMEYNSEFIHVGYGEGGVLTEAVRRKPYSVVLLDEIEKAHPDVHELFFQVFDKGWMEDGEGRYIDFKNTILLLTSNTGSELVTSLYMDPDTAPDFDGLRNMLQPELLKVFPAAFLGRLGVVPYLSLQKDSLQHIVRMHLNHIGRRLMQQHDVTLNYSEQVVEYIVEQCQIVEVGARMLIRFIEQNITPKIGRYILKSGGSISNEDIHLVLNQGECQEIDIVFHQKDVLH